MHASGEFDITMQPMDFHTEGKFGIMLGRMSLDKTFRGDLEAHSRGEMLSARTGVKGSAGYVAIEQVTGTLHGKSGSFVLQHYGMMRAGDSRLILEIVPDSGSDQLTGISGSMNIVIENGKHYFTMEYTL